LEVRPIESAAALLERHDVVDDDRWRQSLNVGAHRAERVRPQHGLAFNEPKP
jgi:hypothetical protein